MAGGTAVSTRERIAHVVRRLGIGAGPDLAAGAADVDEAIAACLDLSDDPVQLAEIDVPLSWDDAEDDGDLEQVWPWWLEVMSSGHQPIQERMTWFWHDHFATSAEKVETRYLMWQQHLTLRRHATGNFADLLKAISRDPAMLVYLDGVDNTSYALNENFGREVMELHTLGLGHYSQEDVVAAARAFTGWQVNWPGERRNRFEFEDEEPWGSVLVEEDHDGSRKTLLGVSGRFGLAGALDILLHQPQTGRRIAAKLFEELVGFRPDEATAARLGDEFASDYEIMPLVRSIVAEPAFVSDDAVRAKIRTPLEKLVSLRQGFPVDPEFEVEWGYYMLEMLGYAPFLPPNPAGFPRGGRLLSPGHLVGAFALLNTLEPPETRSVDALFARLGVYDVSEQSRDVVSGQRDPGAALALAFGSPEFALT